ncbi:MAG: SDR family oxidoreductase [Desulfobacterales bacterium]|jgi:NAD(P)-dependent dehydrogenase (short-subunit alcohol dehydrogenase family)
MGQLDGKTAIITGAARGIGFAIARRFHREGAAVVLCDREEERLSEASARISAAEERILSVKADVMLEDDIKKVVSQTVDRFEGINILVNNAGVVRFGKLEQTDHIAWRDLMRTNAYAPWQFMVAVLPEMRKAGGGSIVNISSINGIKAFPGMGFYSASKAAQQMLSQVMAMEVAEDNIRVNSLLPGLVEDTEFLYAEIGKENLADFFATLKSLHPLGRNTKPKDVADAALFLASDQSEFITGVLLNVDGGRHLATNRPPAA